MRASQFLLTTQKETPADAVVVSHKLMLRAGMIRKSASGLYSWLPLGLKVLRKVEQVVREEMDKSGALEVLMPVVQPAELWKESGRWDQFGPELTRFSDRHDNPFCLGPTHEEIITDLIRNEISSYKQLPLNCYQIQTKFRDEVRPRFGVMRAREFIMKDAYSFHLSHECLSRTYEVMYQTYSNIFSRLGLQYRAVLADTGSIGGTGSHEFHVLADSGEDDIVFSDQGDYAANIEMAEAPTILFPKEPQQPLAKVPTPAAKTVEDVANLLAVPHCRVLKTLFVLGQPNEHEESTLVALVLRGDHDLNEVKAAKQPGVLSPLVFAGDDIIRQQIGAGIGSLGPIGLNIPVIIDRSAAEVCNFVCGANEDGFHFTGADWDRDIGTTRIADLRNIERGDACPDGKGQVDIRRGIEVGHIFQLGDKYSSSMKAKVLNEQGKEQTLIMGCYGIGVSRIVAAAIEQNHDSRGIIWPDALAPFHLAIVPINMHKSEKVKEQCELLYRSATDAGLEVLYMDEHKARLGVMLADVELIGVPHRLVVGDKGLESGQVEYQGRRDSESRHVPLTDLLDFLKERIRR